jgi:putative SOS response-associated peptidase YedK
MCVQYLPTSNAAWVKSKFNLDLPSSQVVDIFPTQSSPLILQSHSSKRTAIGMARFGLLPVWAKDLSFGKKTYNARVETVDKKPSYCKAWKKRQFGLVLADVFYEPHYQTGKALRQGICAENFEPLAIASIWDTWTDIDTGELITSFSLLTINADEHPLMNQFHKPEDEKRTIVPLRMELFNKWLSATTEEAFKLLKIDSMVELCMFDNMKKSVDSKILV